MGVSVRVPESTGLTRGEAWLRRFAWASLVGNITIVLTGGIVRLTGSGLGCPTWPNCTEDSLVPRGELGHYELIEFGNRMVTFLLAAIAIGTLIAAWRRGGVVRTLAILLAVGVPLQAVIGGITVLTDLNPWIVSLHLVASLIMISLSVLLLDRVYGRPKRPLPTAGFLWLPWLAFVAGWIVLYLGTVVTGAGPHAGDADAPRNNLDPRSMSQLHTDFVMIFFGLVIAIVIVVHAVAAHKRLRVAALTLLGVVLAQGLVGFVQYFTHLPIVLVLLHLLGASLTAAAMTWVLVEAGQRGHKHPHTPSEVGQALSSRSG